MDLVTILVSVIFFYVIIDVISYFMNNIKDKLKDPPPRVVIKKGSRTIETFFLTDDQLERLQRELKEGYEGSAAQSAVNN